MEKIIDALHSTNVNIEKLLHLLAAQNTQQKLLSQIILKQIEKDDIENSSTPIATEAEKEFANAYQNFCDLLNLISNSYHFVENSFYNLTNSYHFSENEIYANSNSYHSSGSEVSKVITSYDGKMIGVTEGVASTFKKMVGVTNNNLLQKQPESIDIAKIDSQKFSVALRVAMLKCSNNCVKNAGIILKQLYQNPKQSHKELMKLTKLSVDGMAKHVRMLKKRELVVKMGFQHYELTEKSLGILRDGMA